MKPAQGVEALLESGRGLYDEMYEGAGRHFARVDWTQTARLLSDLLAPVFLGVLVWVPLSLRYLPTWQEALLNVGLAFVFFVLVPLAVPFYYLRKGMDTIHVHRRELRWLPMLVALAGYVAFYALEVHVMDAPALGSVLLLFFLATVPFLLVTLKWKISVHMSGNAMALATLASVYPLAWLLFVVHAPVGWARVHLKGHTLAQVLAGLAYGTLASFLWFKFFPLP